MDSTGILSQNVPMSEAVAAEPAAIPEKVAPVAVSEENSVGTEPKVDQPEVKPTGDEPMETESKVEEKSVSPAKSEPKVEEKSVSPAKSEPKVEEKSISPAKSQPKVDEKSVSPAKSQPKLDEKPVSPAKSIQKSSAIEETAEPPESQPKVPAKRGRKPAAAKISTPKPPKAAEVAFEISTPKPSKAADGPSEDAVMPPQSDGKRQRKPVERFTAATPVVHEKESQIPDGRGVRLCQIPFVDAMIEKHKSEDLRLLHRTIFGRSGTSHEIKRNIRQFHGFEFTKDSAEFAKKLKVLESWQKSHLTQVCDILGLSKSKSKEDLSRELGEFLLEPKDLGLKVPTKGPKRKRRSRSSKTPEKPKKKVADKVDSSGESSEESSAAESEEEAEEPKAKKSKTDEKTPKKTTAKALMKVDKTMAPAKETTKKSAATADGKFPNDKQIEAAIKKQLKGADLEKVTMNTVCEQIYGKFPGFDLTGKKTFIKNKVKEIISKSE